MRLGHVAGQAGDHPARVRPPVRGEQAGERRYEVAPAVVLDLAGQLVDLRCAGDDAEVVAQPLDERAGDRDRALKRVDRLGCADLVPDRGQQAAPASDRLLAGVEQEEGAGAVRALGLAGVEAGLPEQGRRLVAEGAGHRYAAEVAARLAVDVRGGQDLRQHRPGYAERVQQLRVPVHCGQTHQHGTAGVGHVRRMPPGQPPDQPGVDGAEEHLALLRPQPEVGHLVEQPTDLRSREVGRQRQPARRPEPVRALVTGQLPDDPVGTGVLPHDRRVHRLARTGVPEHRRLALVGDPDRGQVGPGQARLVERRPGNRLDVVPDLRGVVLHPARTRVDLPVLAMVLRDDPAVDIEDDAAGGGRTLVDRGDVGGRHADSVPATANRPRPEPLLARSTGSRAGPHGRIGR